jgi:hypothetical protein
MSIWRLPVLLLTVRLRVYLLRCPSLRSQLLQFCLEVSQPPLENLTLLIQPLEVLLAAQKTVPAVV